MYYNKSIFSLILLVQLLSDLAFCDSAPRSADDDDSADVAHSMTTEVVPGTEPDEAEQFDATYPLTSTAKNDMTYITKQTENNENDLETICPHFRNLSKINIERMADVWQTIYYQVPHRVPCFKILIRIVTAEEKNRYSQLYGDFNDKVIWDDCNLEVKSSAGRASRKHFLQGCEKSYGVLENIIFEQKDNDTVVSLHEESPDQWLVVKNLLLMRDCENGQIVVFSRVPRQPKLDEVMSAIEHFGKGAHGEWACNEGSDKSDRRQAFNADFESDSDVVFF